MAADATYCDLTDNYTPSGSQVQIRDYVKLTPLYNESTGSEYGHHYEPAGDNVSEHRYRPVNNTQVDLQSERPSTVNDLLSVRHRPILQVDTINLPRGSNRPTCNMLMD